MTDAPAQLADMLKSWLKSHTSQDKLSLPHDQVRTLFESLQVLRQSNDRLRRQNKKVRNQMHRQQTDVASTADFADGAPGHTPS
mgnify:CR=1 FL=1